jgi:peptidoglycan hydrolase CwlO-like protein
MQEVEQFFINHFSIVASLVAIIVGYIRLQQASKNNEQKLDTVITETKNVSNSQHNMQVELSKYGMQMSSVAKDIGEIKHDTRSHDKEISALKAELAGVKSQLKAS